MKKYGEIDRFNINGLLYILRVFKASDHKYEDLYIPGFDISISKRTGKKHKREDPKYSLLNEGFQSLKTIKKIEQIIKDYLDYHKPNYLAISAFKDSMSIFYKRILFYDKRLQGMGYKYDSLDKDWEESIYYFKRIDKKE